MKIKLRVPFGNAHLRETSSPLANPIQATAEQHEEDGNGNDNDGDANEDEDMEIVDAQEGDEGEEDEADELDEMDELEDDQDTTAAAVTNTSTPTKRNRLTLKARGSRGNGGETISPSPSNSIGDGSMSPVSAEAHARLQSARKAGLGPRSSIAKTLTVEELDALPAAKRRKSAKARGAAGPGRGWRKGLTKGQKPVYELPPHQRTPASFGNTSDSAAPSSPTSSAVASRDGTTKAAFIASDTQRRPSTTIAPARAAPASAAMKVGTSSSSRTSGAATVKVSSGPGGQTFVGDLSAKAGTAKNPGFRYPPLPSSRGGPPVQPLARIPTAFQAAIALEKNKKEPRRWVKAEREILSLGGRPWSVSVYYGGDDRGYEKYAETAAAVSAVSGPKMVIGGAATTPVANPAAATDGAATPTRTKTPATNKPAQAATPPAESISRSASATGLSAKGNPALLPAPKHLSGLKEDGADWRGQSPAFLFGSR